MDDDFDLGDFLPYALNRAAEAAGLGFSRVYRARYGMLRTEWRVLFHLGRHGDQTARAICDRANLHKTKVSRAVAGLEKRRFLQRRAVESDRRKELLSLTAQGKRVFRDLEAKARTYDETLAAMFDADEMRTLRACLRRLAELPG